MSEKVSVSQSLFQIFYLGQTPVDRRCSKSVMPWIIEELKLHTETKKFLWLTPGPDGVTYVADNGQELFGHTYSSIIRCCIALDGISFAYIALKESENKYFCHVFQAFTYDEADLIMRQFNSNAKGESLPEISGDESNNKLLGQGKKDTGLAKHQTPPTSRSRASSDPPPLKTSTPEYHLRYVGNMEISFNSSSQSFMDSAVRRFREAYAKRQKEKKKKRKLAKAHSHSSGSSLDSIDFPISIKAESKSCTSEQSQSSTSEQSQSGTSEQSQSGTSEQSQSGTSEQSQSSTSEQSQSSTSEHSESSGNMQASLAGTEKSQFPRRENCEITVEVTRSSPEGDFTEKLVERLAEIDEQSESSQEETAEEAEIKEPIIVEPMAEEACEQVGGREENGEQYESNITEPTPNEVVEERERQSLAGGVTEDNPGVEKAVSSGLESKRPPSLYTEEVTFMMGDENLQEDDAEGEGHEEEVEEKEEEASGSPATMTAAVCKRALTVVPSGEMEGMDVPDGQDTENGASKRFLVPESQVSQPEQGEREAEKREEGERREEEGERREMEEGEKEAEKREEGERREMEEGEKEAEKGEEGERREREEVDADDYDTLPELDSLYDSAEFQELGKQKDLTGKRVRLVISGLSVAIFSTQSGEQLLRRTIRSISCCAQGNKEKEYVGFICREGGARKCYCHLLKAENERMANKVLESFKSAFIHALSVALPSTLCDTCPLQQLHELCQSIDGVSMQVAQSRIQGCLSSFTEGDYASIMKQFKETEHANHDYTQVVVLVAILRRYFHKKQEGHTHPNASQVRISEREWIVDKSVSTNRTRLSALERTKMALASSFENLRSRKNLKKATPDGNSVERSITPEPRGSQSLNLPTNTSIFMRKTDIDSLMDPISSLAGKVEEKEKGSGSGIKRSWSGSGGSFKLRRRWNLRKVPSDETHDGEKTKQANSEDKKVSDEKVQDKPSSGKSKNGEEGTADGTASAVLNTQIVHPIASSSRPSSTSPPLSPLLSSRQKGNISQAHSFLPQTLHTPARSPITTRRSTRPRAQKHDLSLLQRRTSRYTPPPGSASALPQEFLRSHRRSMSWRQEIFESVSTPTKTERNASIGDFEWIEPPPIDQLGGGAVEGERESRQEVGRLSPRTRTRERWKSAIQQQILLNRMDKENQLFEKAATQADMKRRKLCYTDPILNVQESTQAWNTLLTQDKPDTQDVHKALIQGVTPNRRSEVWRFLIGQYQARKTGLEYDSTSQGLFYQLCQETSEYDHVILTDVGRTFPSHPYFSKGKKRGQQSLYDILHAYAVADPDTGYCQGLSFLTGMLLIHQSLYNILHAYAVADPDTGYCQGLSFLTGMLLIHSKDDESAYVFLHQLMQLYNYREVFSPDLSILQVRLYQLSRLLHDFAPALYQHFKQYEVTPFLYAAPWFLTLFASQYPLAFVARVMDIFFYEGPDIVFRIALSLLMHHKEAVLQCRAMEATCIYLKNKLPEEILTNMSTILENALKIDLGNRLQSFEAEFLLMEELRSSFPVDLDAPDLESMNEALRKQNRALIEQLAITHGAIRTLEDTVQELRQKMETLTRSSKPDNLDVENTGQPSDEDT